MSEGGFNLPKSAAANMLEKEFYGDLNNQETVYNKMTTNGRSPIQKWGDAQKEFSDSLTPALKKMKIAYFEAVNESCYQDHHISDSFSNTE